MTTEHINDLVTKSDSIYTLNAYRMLANKLMLEINSKSSLKLDITERFEAYEENFSEVQLHFMENLMKAGYIEVGDKTIKHYIEIKSQGETICSSMKVIRLENTENGKIASKASTIVDLNSSWMVILNYLLQEGVFAIKRAIEHKKQQQGVNYTVG